MSVNPGPYCQHGNPPTWCSSCSATASTSGASPKDALYDAIRDQLARILHDWDHGNQENDSPTEPCWQNYRVEADLLIPAIRPHLVTAWEVGARSGARGFSERQGGNPYREHRHECACAYCYSAAMGGGR